MALRKDIRIMVVDDMSVSRQILVQLLEQMGVTDVLTATEGSQAISLLHARPADIVIADLNMPGMDGLELLKRVRDDRHGRRVGFVLTSGDDSTDRIDEAWRAGMDRFLPKPFDHARLVTCLESVTGRL